MTKSEQLCEKYAWKDFSFISKYFRMTFFYFVWRPNRIKWYGKLRNVSMSMKNQHYSKNLSIFRCSHYSLVGMPRCSNNSTKIRHSICLWYRSIRTIDADLFQITSGYLICNLFWKNPWFFWLKRMTLSTWIYIEIHWIVQY